MRIICKLALDDRGAKLGSTVIRHTRKGARLLSRLPADQEEAAALDTLMLAACNVIGRHGYKGASVARIAEEAGISQGHCYKFFASRDDILEEVVVWMMEKFNLWASRKQSKVKTFLELEHLNISQMFSYQKKFPFFFRILHDSEVETPSGWKRFADKRSERHLEELRLAKERGEIIGYRDDQLPELRRFLSAVRRGMVFGSVDDVLDSKRVLDTYDTFLRQAIGCPAASDTVVGKPRSAKPIVAS